MRFADLSPGLASAIENLGGDAETLVSSAGTVAGSDAGSTAPATTPTTVGVDDLVSLFTTADEAEAQRNKVENENVARFLKPADDEAPARRQPQRPEAKKKPDEQKREAKSEKRAVPQPKLQARSAKREGVAPKEGAPAPDAPATEEPPERREVEMRMAEDPRSATKHRERPTAAKKHARADGEADLREQPAKQGPATRDGARVRASRKEAQLRTHLEAKNMQTLQKEGMREAHRAERRRADRKTADRKAMAQLDSQQQSRESKPQDKERAMAWKEGFEAFDNLHVKGGHGWADFMLDSDDVEDDPLGLNEADLLNDGLRCKGHVDDGSRCLRRPPEGEMYCREHRTALPVFWD